MSGEGGVISCALLMNITAGGQSTACQKILEKEVTTSEFPFMFLKCLPCLFEEKWNYMTHEAKNKNSSQGTDGHFI